MDSKIKIEKTTLGRQHHYHGVNFKKLFPLLFCIIVSLFSSIGSLFKHVRRIIISRGNSDVVPSVHYYCILLPPYVLVAFVIPIRIIAVFRPGSLTPGYYCSVGGKFTKKY